MSKFGFEFVYLLWNHALVKVIFLWFICIFDAFVFREWRLFLDDFVSKILSLCSLFVSVSSEDGERGLAGVGGAREKRESRGCRARGRWRSREWWRLRHVAAWGRVVLSVESGCTWSSRVTSSVCGRRREGPLSCIGYLGLGVCSDCYSRGLALYGWMPTESRVLSWLKDSPWLLQHLMKRQLLGRPQ